MDCYAQNTPFVQAAFRVAPGLEQYGMSSVEPMASGACTPDFLAARARPSTYTGDEVHHIEGIATPRDGSKVAKITMEQLHGKLYDTWSATPQQHGVANAPLMRLQDPHEWLWQTSRGASAPSMPEPQVPPPPMPHPEVPRAPANRTVRSTTRAAGRAAAAAFVVSVGSVGHPSQCAAMCEKDICEEGPACKKCHLCKVEEKEKEAKLLNEIEAKAVCPSVGSMGHPKSCGEACKFYYKNRGCKDGTLCTRCHLCRWNRYQTSKKG